MHKIFVYGTLMTGLENNYLLSDSKLIGKGFSLDRFVMTARFIPFLRREESDSDTNFLSHVFGEIYLIDDYTLNKIDDLEGHPTYYKRELINVMSDMKSEPHECWCYLRSGAGADVMASTINSGNYYEYRFNNEKVKRMIK